MAEQPSFHEDFSSRQEVKAGSERSLGIVFAVVLAVIGLWPLLGGGAARLWALIAAGAFLGLGLFVPKLLRPLNKAWFLFGKFLHKIVNPIIMALLFFTTVTPTGIIMRLMGKDPLHRKLDPDAKSYWIVREPPGPDPKTMRQQF
ncbi:MAG: SxtJ family membrane protein [Rhodospirillales bacterium]